jgi:hypothetical protein
MWDNTNRFMGDLAIMQTDGQTIKGSLWQPDPTGA